MVEFSSLKALYSRFNCSIPQLFVIRMSAIAGIISKRPENVGVMLVKMLSKLSHRGTDQFGITINGNTQYSKDLHALDVTKLEGPIGLGSCLMDIETSTFQPFTVKNGFSVVDIEWINSQEDVLAFTDYRKYDKFATFGRLLERDFDGDNFKNWMKKIIEKLGAGFSCGILYDNNVILARDIVGIKPLFLGENENLIAFASEKKALWELGILDSIRPILPGEVVVVNEQSSRGYNLQRYSKNSVVAMSLKDCIRTLEKLLITSISKRINSQEVALLFSGGLDSSILAFILKKLGVGIQLFCACYKDSKDYKNSKKISKILKLPLEMYELTDEEIRDALNKIIYHLENNDTVTAEIATPIYFATELAKKFGFKTIFTGQGADELFGGYSRYEKIVADSSHKGLQEALYNDVINIWQKNILRDDMISMGNSIELQMPYLDNKLVDYCLKIPPEYKVKKTKSGYVRKYILRELGKRLKIPAAILSQSKLAIHYGSGATKGFKRLANRLGMDIDQIRSYGFKSANELLLNLLSYKLGFPKVELKNAARLGDLLSKNQLLSKL